MANTQSSMIIINFGHPFTEEQKEQLEMMISQPIQEILDVNCRFDVAESLGEQVAECVEAVALTSEEWRTEPVLISLPGFAPAAAALVAELNGRMGYFPSLIRLRPVSGSTPARYQVTEIINLQAIRNAARGHRRP